MEANWRAIDELKTLQDLRVAINEVDEQILKLFARREEICIKIGEVKKAEGKAVLDTSREQEKIDKNSAFVEKQLEESSMDEDRKECVRIGTRNLTETLMAEGRRIQSVQ